MALGEPGLEQEQGRGGRCRLGGADFMPQPCPPLRRKMPRSGRWCSASTSCKLSARRPSAGWRSKCGRSGGPGSQSSAPCGRWGWTCLGVELDPLGAALSEVGRDSPGDQIFALPLWDPGRGPTAGRTTARGVSPFPKRRSGPISGYPAGVRERPPHSGVQGHFLGAFRWSVRVQGLRA